MSVTPFDQVVGSWLVYIAAATEAAPDVDDAPVGNWVLLGPTDGGQTLDFEGDLEFFMDDESQGPRKSVRPEENVKLTLAVVGLTLDNFAKMLSLAANVATAAGPPAIKTLPLVRGYDPTVYSILLRGEAHSPYGSLPAQYWIPMMVADGSPSIVMGKTERQACENTFTAIWDAAQASGDEFGYLEAQTA